MSSHAVVHTPVGGELMTPFFRKLLLFVGLGAVVHDERDSLDPERREGDA